MNVDNLKTGELQCIFDARKSFGHKATVTVIGPLYVLSSYGVNVCQYDDRDGSVTMFPVPNANSQTTRRHKREFLRQLGLNPADYM